MHSDLKAALKTGYVLVLMFCVVVSEPLRLRRQTTSRYTIDTLVVVDEKMFSWFQQWLLTTSNDHRSDVEAKLKEYVSLVIHQANTRFSNIKDLPYVVALQVVSISANQSILSSIADRNSGKVEPDKALETFQLWLQNSQLGRKYDHAILLTGYLLESTLSGAETKGRAFVGRMCDVNGYSASIVQESGGFQSAHYVAHEVAHNLGSVHDGEGTSSNCSPTYRYIMAPVRDTIDTTQTKFNPWYFSQCSSTKIGSIIKSITSPSSESNCLSANLTPMPEFSATSTSVPGQLYPADMQCQMLYGRDSRVCLGSSFSNLDEICTSMFCLLETDSSRCAKHFAAEGTSCGNKKWCRSGMCEYSDNAPARNDKCPNGDSFTKINDQDCANAIKANPHFCYNEAIRGNCCQSCEAIRRNSEVCPYGDKVSQCRKDYCTDDFLVNNRPATEVCCGTCDSDVTSNCVDVTGIDNVSCAIRTERNERQECYNTTVATSCCQTCAKMWKHLSGCEYGDHDLSNNCTITQDNQDACIKRKSDCCYSCRSYNKSSSIHWTTMPLFVVVLLWICYKS